jgi:alcohol dehydrogenase (cytochrome c)
MMTRHLVLAAAATLTCALVPAQVTYERILNAEKEPGNWLTYSGNYKGWRYSPLDQINRTNAGQLKVKWVHQMPTTHMVETSPIVADGVMYVSEPPSNVVALDAATGREFWRYRRELPANPLPRKPGPRDWMMPAGPSGCRELTPHQKA